MGDPDDDPHARGERGVVLNIHVDKHGKQHVVFAASPALDPRREGEVREWAEREVDRWREHGPALPGWSVRALADGSLLYENTQRW